ncbi:MAG: ABC transporter permease [Blastomonas sp.]
MADFADFTLEDAAGDALNVHFSGVLVIETIGDLPQQLGKIEQSIGAIDLAAVDKIDTAGAWLVYRLGRDSGAEIRNMSTDADRLIRAVGDADQGGEVRPEPLPPFLRIMGQAGEAVFNAFNSLIGMIAFLGEIIIALGGQILHPGRIRWGATFRHFEQVGVTALGIVGLMSFLIGIVIAQQGAVQLRQFGAEVFTINLVGRITLRELGVLMTAIMVAGRSGSAFAAQIGTMKMTEEVDAMRTIGVSPIEALVLPRVAASVLMMPLLGFYASVMAIIGGGLLCWITLEIPPVTFVQRIQEVVPMHDLYVGLVKAPVFGLIVAMAGCFQGMQVRGNAEEVGMRTTAAVVQAIFMVIVLDAFFAVFFTEVGWG